MFAVPVGLGKRQPGMVLLVCSMSSLARVVALRLGEIMKSSFFLIKFLLIESKNSLSFVLTFFPFANH